MGDLDRKYHRLRTEGKTARFRPVGSRSLDTSVPRVKRRRVLPARIVETPRLSRNTRPRTRARLVENPRIRKKDWRLIEDRPKQYRERPYKFNFNTHLTGVAWVILVIAIILFIVYLPTLIVGLGTAWFDQIASMINQWVIDFQTGIQDSLTSIYNGIQNGSQQAVDGMYDLFGQWAIGFEQMFNAIFGGS